MIYLLQNNHGRKTRARIIVGISAPLLVIVIAVQLIFPHFFPAVVTSVIRPFWRTEFAVGVGSLRSAQTLLAENEILKLQLSEANIRLDTIGAIETENRELKSFFGRDIFATSTGVGTSTQSRTAFQRMLSSAMKNKRILAPILIRPGEGIYDELIIDGGKDLGFKVGAKVYAPGDILIGSISDVLPQTSKVALLSSAGNILNVLIGPSNASATAIGRGGGQYTAELPRSVSISEGDFVIVPSIDDKPFGVVSSVIANPAQSFQTILFAPPINIYQLRWVLVEPST